MFEYVFSTDMYKIVRSDGRNVCLDRPILPDAIIFAVICFLAACLVFFVWDDPGLEGWFWFGSIALGLMIYALFYLLLPDKRIILEEDGSIFVLRGKHWFSKRNSAFSSEGNMAARRVTASGGENARNFVLEVKTYDGLRFMMGFHTFGSFKKERLEELGKLLEEESRGRLTLVD